MIRYVITSAMLLTALGAVAIPANTPRIEIFTLRGIVRDEVSGRALSGVAVAADSSRAHRTMSDSAGRYEIRDVPLGDYSVMATRLGYYVERRELAVHCEMHVADARGRATPAPACRPGAQSLNFYMRVHVQR